MTAVTEHPATLELDAADREIRDINRDIRSALAEGRETVVRNPGARHNLGVGLLSPGLVTCAGMSDGATIRIRGSAGWGVAEGMLAGLVTVEGNAGNGAAASIRGGTVVVHGDCAARAGISMKGGRLLIGGNAGYMTAFMMQKGTVVICGNAGEALADSMYEGTVFVGGSIASLGNDAVSEAPSADDDRMLDALFTAHDVPRPPALQKIVSGRKLWNFEKHELETWREAL
jgi:glutamate synthase domain-containing protein 3